MQTEHPPEKQIDSPRTAVAEELRNLDIHRQPDPEQREISTSPSPAKRIKRNQHLEPEDYSGDRLLQAAVSDPTIHTLSDDINDGSLLEREESPVQPPPLPLSDGADDPSPEKERGSVSPKARTSTASKTSTKRLRSPPPPASEHPSPKTHPATPPAQAQTQNSPFPDQIHPPTQTLHFPNPTLQTLRPRPSYSSSSYEDDGEGINGIGFRPTPALAFLRRQKRKQQVSEWKAREGKEARERRMERRRGAERGSGGGAGNGERNGRGDGGTRGRGVRFVEGV
ncbi:hypothetical protein LTR62_003418 [Meristemomyces frigidus]|uniref:Uncharacterized protein n=1 Tax=Meristemomyces frigidus TaxID=1508187 RepID=A0AAN7YH37_9PEZI|nr:hypothetical protein LTR62_003418 [Meristemomyces frigidus]